MNDELYKRLEPILGSVTHSPERLYQAILAELAAAGYAVVKLKDLKHWASAYDEVLRFSKWHTPSPRSVFNDSRAQAYADVVRQLREAAGMIAAAEQEQER